MLGFGAVSEMIKSYRQNRERMKHRKKPGKQKFFKNAEAYKINIQQKIGDEAFEKFRKQLVRERKKNIIILIILFFLLFILAAWIAVYMAHSV